VVGWGEERWWSRLAPPALHSWTADRPLRRREPERPEGAPAPNAVACSGRLRPETTAVWRRVVEGRPGSHGTTAVLAWVWARLARGQKRGRARVWANAAGPIRRAVRPWRRPHQQRVKRAGGGRLRPCRLPVTSPWLTAIEPRWGHGKPAIMDPARLLTAAEVMARVCAAVAAEQVAPLPQQGA
jgi:hypothetical protein